MLPPLTRAALFLFAAALVSGCKPTAEDVRARLESRGYTHVVIDPANNADGIFHFTASRSFEECKGTVLLADDRLESVTCWATPRLFETPTSATRTAP